MADIKECLPLERSSVQFAHELIKQHVHKTPVLTCKTLNDLASTPQSPESLIGTPFEGQTPASPKIHFFFKCENYQRIGAFKIRGASHALARLSDEALKNGVVTHSSGNHAQALALAARTRGIKAFIVMPTISTPSKIGATQGYGAEVIFSGSTSEEREAVVDDVIKRTNAVLVPPYDHPDIILGQGTMALELESQVQEMVARNPGLSVHDWQLSNGALRARENESGHPEPILDETTGQTSGTTASTTNGNASITSEFGHLDAVIAPLGGGGMLAGIATALSPTPTLVFGAEPSFQGADDGRRGLSISPPTRITTVKTLTIADGLRTPVGPIPWTIISDRRKVRGVFSVTEEQIVRAMRLVLERMKVVVEPSSVVGLAVALWDEDFRKKVEREGGKEGWDVGIVFSGGNVGVEALGRMFAGGEGLEERQNKAERAEGKVGLDGTREAENVAG